MRVLILVACLVTTSISFAYDPDAPRKIAAPEDTAFNYLSGYDSFSGTYKQRCIKPVAARPFGVDPDGKADIQVVNSLSEVIRNRQLDVHASLNLNFGLYGGSAKVNTSFAKKHKSSIESSAVSLSFVDLRRPQFVPPNARYQFNKRGQEAFAHLTQGRVNRFREMCGDSVIVGQQKGRRLTGVATVESKDQSTQVDRQTQVDIAARYMLSKAKASVNLSDSETNIAKDLRININYEISGNSRQSGATTPEELRTLFVDFPKDTNSVSVQYVYLLPILDLVKDKPKAKGVETADARKIRAIIDGFSMLLSARNAAYAELQHRNRINQVRTEEAHHKTRTTDGIYIAQLLDSDSVERTYRALAREVAFLNGKIRQQRGCTPTKGKSAKLNRECQSLHARLARIAKAMRFSSADKNRWMHSFLSNAYASEPVCKTGFVVSLPSGRRVCRRCDIAKEPRFNQGQEGTCGYVTNKRRSKKATRFWAKDLVIEGKGKNRYPNRCNRNDGGCGQAAANRLCEAKGLKQASYFEVWDWRPDNPIHHKKITTVYANGKACKESKDEFTPKRCRTFKLIDCIEATKQANQTNAKKKKKKKKKQKKKKNN